MELSEFIKDVTLEIIEGMKVTQDSINKKGIKAIVNPTDHQLRGDYDEFNWPVETDTSRFPELIIELYNALEDD